MSKFIPKHHIFNKIDNLRDDGEDKTANGDQTDLAAMSRAEAKDTDQVSDNL